MDVQKLAPLPATIPLVMAAVLVVLEKVPGKRRLLDVLAVATVLGVAAADLLLLRQSLRHTLVYWFGGWSPMNGFPVGICFAIDPAGAGLAFLAALLTAMGLLYSWQYFKAIGIFYHTLMLLFLASMEGFCLTGDLFNMFVFFELMGVAAYALTGYDVENTGPLEGALNFSVMNSIGAFMVLLGIGIIYAKSGGLNLAWAGNFIAGHGADPAMKAALVLLVVGFLVKAAIIPFHFWLPDAHAVAPTPASVLFSGIMVELGLYAIARIYWAVFSGGMPGMPLQELLLIIGLATAILGAFMAFIQRHMKRLLAYSTVSHSGLMLAGLALFDRSALGGTLLYIVGHGCVKGGLFICSGIVLSYHSSVDEDSLRGKGRHLRLPGILFCLGGLALAGLPPFGTFAGKAMIERAAEAQGYGWWLPGIFLFSSAVTGGAVLRAGASIFFGLGAPDFLSLSAPSTGAKEPPETSGEGKKLPLMMWLPVLILMAAALAAGAVPGGRERAAEAAARFADGAGYRKAVLEAVVAGNPVAAGGETGGMGAGIAATAAALLLAGGALYSSRLPKRLLKMASRAMTPAVSALRGIHSGYIGDYVAWFMLGAAVTLLAALGVR